MELNKKSSKISNDSKVILEGQVSDRLLSVENKLNTSIDISMVKKRRIMEMLAPNQPSSDVINQSLVDQTKLKEMTSQSSDLKARLSQFLPQFKQTLVQQQDVNIEQIDFEVISDVDSQQGVQLVDEVSDSNLSNESDSDSGLASRNEEQEIEVNVGLSILDMLLEKIRDHSDHETD